MLHHGLITIIWVFQSNFTRSNCLFTCKTTAGLNKQKCIFSSIQHNFPPFAVGIFLWSCRAAFLCHSWMTLEQRIRATDFLWRFLNSQNLKTVFPWASKINVMDFAPLWADLGSKPNAQEEPNNPKGIICQICSEKVLKTLIWIKNRKKKWPLRDSSSQLFSVVSAQWNCHQQSMKSTQKSMLHILHWYIFIQ